MMFPYSLEGAAKTWYEKEPPNSILTWEDLVTKFVNQFFPPSKTTHLKNKISRFTQKFDESFSEAWERFKEMLRACPHHGFMELTQVDTFYNVLSENDQDSLNAAAGGNLLSKTTREALNIIKNKSKVRYSRNKPNASRMNTTSKESVSKTDERIDKLADQLSTLVEIVSTKVVTPAPVKAVEETCVTCGGAHSWYNCPTTDNNQASVCATTGTYNQVNPPNRVSNQMAPPGFAPVQNNGQNSQEVGLLNLDKTKNLPPYHDNQSSGNPIPISKPETKSSSSSPTLISLKESELIWEEFEAYLARDSFPPGNLNPSSLLPLFHNSLSGSTNSSSPSLYIFETSNYFLEEFADELAHITFPPGNDDLPFDAESDLLELEYLLNHDPIKDMDSILEDSVDENSLDDNLDDTISEMFTDEHALDYSSPPLWDDYDDNLFDHETVNDDTYDDPFDFKEEKIKDSKILIDELDLPESNNVLPFLECDSVFYEDFSEVDALSSTNNEDKVFNPGILIHENLFEVTNFATPDKNVKKTTNASLILEDFNPPLYELPFHKEVPGLGALLSFSPKNEEKVYNPGILTSKRVHTSLLPELSHRGTKAFKVTKILESPMKIFPCSYQEDIRVLDVLMSRIFEASRARGFVLRSYELQILSFISESDILILSTNVYL
ncbi:reverse transcriptase domain-containing protein [Tanacetum coccineum]